MIVAAKQKPFLFFFKNCNAIFLEFFDQRQCTTTMWNLYFDCVTLHVVLGVWENKDLKRGM